MTRRRAASLLGRPIGFLASGRLAVVVLTVAVALLAVYLLVPQLGPERATDLEGWVEQKGIVGSTVDALGLTDVRNSWIFYATYGVLFVNLLLCMVRRAPAAAQQCRFPDRSPRVGSTWVQCEVPAGRIAAEEVGALLAKRGYRTRVEANSVYGLRGRLTVVGHWLFHGGFLLLMVGGIVLMASPQPFRGRLGIGEGEPFDVHRTPFIGANHAVSSDLPELQFEMKGIDARVEGSELRHFQATLEESGGGRATMAINRPYRKAPYQVMVHGFGLMPAWVIVNQRGRPIFGNWVKLIPFPLAETESFVIGANEGRVDVHLFPDYERTGELERSVGYAPRNPRFRARIEWHGEQVFEGLLEPEQRVRLGPGREFYFHPEIRMYAMVDVIQERGHVLTFACMALMVVGLAWRYVRIRKEVVVEIRAGSLRVAGRCESLQALFAEELAKLASALASTSTRPTGETVRVGP
jgi:hypothetical protein